MTRFFALIVAFLGAAFLIQSADTVQAGGQKSDSKVKITAKAAKPDASGKQIITITLAHEKGWHTYANPVGQDDLDSSKTVVTVLSKSKAIDAKIEYPAGKLIKDKLVGDYKTYEEKTEIKASIRRPVGDGPLEVNVKFMACSGSTCLLPATVKVTVP